MDGTAFRLEVGSRVPAAVFGTGSSAKYSSSRVVGLGTSFLPPWRRRQPEAFKPAFQGGKVSKLSARTTTTCQAPQPDYEVFVRIGDGDSLQRLAKAFRCEQRDFVKANVDIIAKNGDLIYEGDLLRVPSFAWKGVTPPGFQGRIVIRPVRPASTSFFSTVSTAVGSTVGSTTKCVHDNGGPLLFLLGGILAVAGAVAVARKRFSAGSSPNIIKYSAPIPSKFPAHPNTPSTVSAGSSNGAGSSVSRVAGGVAAAVAVDSQPTAPAAAAAAAPAATGSVQAAIDSVDIAAAATSLTSRPFSIRATHGGSAAAAPAAAPVEELLRPRQEGGPLRQALPWLAQSKAPAEEGAETPGEGEGSSSEAAPSSPPSSWEKIQSTVKEATPALALGLGTLSSVALGFDGGLQAIGLTAVTSFVAYDLIWGTRREELWKDLTSIKHPNDVVKFLEKRKISPK